MKKREVTRSQRAYIEQALAHVEQKRSQPFSEADEQQILADMESDDEMTRARAVRQICPCRLPDKVFYRLRRAAKRLQRDPSPLVRADALHIEQDARMVARFEAQLEKLKERDEVETLDGGSGEKPWRKQSSRSGKRAN